MGPVGPVLLFAWSQHSFDSDWRWLINRFPANYRCFQFFMFGFHLGAGSVLLFVFFIPGVVAAAAVVVVVVVVVVSVSVSGAPMTSSFTARAGNQVSIRPL